MKTHSEIRRLLINQVEQNKKILEDQNNQGKVPANIYAQKIAFFALIEKYINATDNELKILGLKINDWKTDEPNTTADMYLSKKMRTSPDNHRREAARAYSISNAKSKFPDLF